VAINPTLGRIYGSHRKRQAEQLRVGQIFEMGHLPSTDQMYYLLREKELDIG
jgi:hypothetical protein